MRACRSIKLPFWLKQPHNSVLRAFHCFVRFVKTEGLLCKFLRWRPVFRLGRIMPAQIFRFANKIHENALVIEKSCARRIVQLAQLARCVRLLDAIILRWAFPPPSLIFVLSMHWRTP
jgi:hypothetical protein